MTYDLIGSKHEMYQKLKVLNKVDFIQEFDKLMINGRWGSGKTYFIDAIKSLAEEKKINVLVVDVWKLEYLQNSERMILVELLTNRKVNIRNELSNIGSEKAKVLFNEYIENIGDDALKIEKILKRSIKMISSIKENSNEAEYAGLLDELAFEWLDESLLVDLKIDIIIFDELDRVLPETFIEIVKFIKYFTTNNESLSIAAALNLEQCNSMIKHLYGEHFSSEVYLDKVFKQELEIINYLEEKADYVYNLTEMPDDNTRNIMWTIKQLVCFYYKRELIIKSEDKVGFGFKHIELRDITNFLIRDIDIMTYKLRVNDNQFDQIVEKIMIIFYMMYNKKYYEHINQHIYAEIFEENNYPYKFKNESIDIPCMISKEHMLLIEKFKNAQNNQDIKKIFRDIEKK